jgi:hypothetical protein
LLLSCALLLPLSPTTNQEEYSICISLSAVGSQALGQLSTFCGDYEEVCVSGGFVAEEVNGAGHNGSVQITQDKIMGSLGMLDVTDSKPSGLGTIFFNCQSIRFLQNLYVHLCYNPTLISHLYMK